MKKNDKEQKKEGIYDHCDYVFITIGNLAYHNAAIDRGGVLGTKGRRN